MRTALLWMPCRPPGAELILFSACGTLGGGPVALCEPRHARGNRGLEADLGPDSEQFSATVRTCERRCGRLTVGASAGASARGDVEGRNATVEYHRLAVGAVSRRDRGNGVHCPGRGFTHANVSYAQDSRTPPSVAIGSFVCLEWWR